MRPSRSLARLFVASMARAALCAPLASGVLIATPLYAQTPAPDKEAKKKAGARFKEAEELFRKHAYAAAAQAFEEAYAIAPHPSVMLNAVNAWTMEGQLARAATLCSKLIADPSTDEKSREEARSKMAELRGKISRIEIRGQPQKLTLDGKPIQPGENFVDPGDHMLEGEVGGKKVQRKLTVVAGSSEQVLLDAPAEAPATSGQASPPPTSAPATTPGPGTEPSPPKKGGLPPSVVYVGGAVTLVLAGVTTWSGLDTLAAKDDFNKNPTPQAKDEGKSKQDRTNILIGATAVVGLATAGIALFATNWGSKESKTSASLWVGPGSLLVKGTF